MVLLFYFPAFLIFFFLKWYGYYWANYDFIENVLFTTIFYIPSILLPYNKYRSAFSILGLIIIYIVISLEFITVILDYDYFSKATMLILLETNSDETVEFLSSNSYSLFKIGILLFVLITPLIFNFLFNIDKLLKKVFNYVFFKISFFFFISLMITLAITKYKSTLLQYNFPYVVISSYNYSLKKIERENVFSLENGNFTNITRELSQEKELYIVVIGESTSRKHLSLYNYHINTNPLLSEMKDKLLIYNDVISPHAQTIKSLEKVLTLGNYENIENIYNGTIVQLLNSAGFNTYWISNQKAKGKYETLVYKISKPTKQQIFINKPQNNNISYDGNLLAPLRKIIAKNENKQFIFIHLIGTHTSYSKRYPEEFKIFKSNENCSKKQRVINEYDNAILYNDYVINNIINTVKGTNRSSFVIYFSDHGEDVFDTNEKLLMHNESIGTKPMFDIPFIVFLSDSFKKFNSTIFINENRPYMTDDLIFSISDLLKINFDQNETARSIFSKSFNENRKRIILKNINYDIKFNSVYSK